MSDNLKFYLKRWIVKTKFTLNNKQIRQKEDNNYYNRCIDCYAGYKIPSEKFGCERYKS